MSSCYRRQEPYVPKSGCSNEPWDAKLSLHSDLKRTRQSILIRAQGRPTPRIKNTSFAFFDHAIQSVPSQLCIRPFMMICMWCQNLFQPKKRRLPIFPDVTSSVYGSSILLLNRLDFHNTAQRADLFRDMDIRGPNDFGTCSKKKEQRPKVHRIRRILEERTSRSGTVLVTDQGL